MLAIIGALADLVVDIGATTFSKRPMKKRKRNKKEIGEQARLEAENRPSVRALRELHARGMAELAARREKDPGAR